MKNIFVLGLLLVAMISIAAASSSCPCSRPGMQGGPIVGFDCSVGSPNNLSFYATMEPTLGDEFEFWALKDIDNFTTHATNLPVTVSVDGAELVTLTSDKNGYLSFMVQKPGAYEICGGDAVMNFTIRPEVVEQAEEAANDTADNETEETRPPVQEPPTEEPSDEPPAEEPAAASGGDSMDWTYPIVAVIAVVVVILFILIKKP